MIAASNASLPLINTMVKLCSADALVLTTLFTFCRNEGIPISPRVVLHRSISVW